MFALSFGCHLAIFLLVAWFRLLPAFRPVEEAVTYVDVVTLPVASPQSGTPVPATAPKPAPAAPVAPPGPPVAMAVPAAQPKAKAPAPSATKAKTAKPAPAEDEHEFDERMAKLERMAEDKRQAQVIKNLQKAGGRVGMPGGKGTQAGSDYSSYLQSRLMDAFKPVIGSRTKSPLMVVMISVGSDGRIAYQVEKNSGDPLFDDSVARAIKLAGKSLKPPPGGAQFKRRFGFEPEKVAVR